jgi:hypothetical protein
VGRRAGRLAHHWISAQGRDADRFALTEAFLGWAIGVAPLRKAPSWLDEVDALVGASATPPRTIDLARRFGVSTTWLARAYRHWRGEGLAEA